MLASYAYTLLQCACLRTLPLPTSRCVTLELFRPFSLPFATFVHNPTPQRIIFSGALVVPYSLSHSFSFFLSHIHTHTLTHVHSSHTYTLTHTLTHSHSHTFSLSLSLSLAPTPAPAPRFLTRLLSCYAQLAGWFTLQSQSNMILCESKSRNFSRLSRCSAAKCRAGNGLL